MASKFYALLTTRGEAKLAQAVALGTQLKITQMAVGDGGGAIPTPNASQTKLVNQQRIAAINTLNVDPVNTSQIIAEQVIPEDEGGWWIREVGLFDDAGELIAVANCAETYKPKLTEGSGRTQVIRMIVVVSSTEAVTIKIDPSVVLATRIYVDNSAVVVRQYADSLMSAHSAAVDPHQQYSPKASPTFTGTPKAPTAAAGNNSTQLANTAFVQAALAALAGTAPEALDTLKKLADALGNDPHFSATVIDALSKKMDINKNGADIADVSAFLKSLGLGDGSALPVGVPVPWVSATTPTGWIKCNGAAFSAADYPKLAKAYPSLKLPDLRGEFIRGWDDGRGVDSGRIMLSTQSFAMQEFTGSFGGFDLNNDGLPAFDGPFRAEARTSLNFPSGGTITLGEVGASFDLARAAQTALETRPRNIAFNYIVRAA